MTVYRFDKSVGMYRRGRSKTFLIVLISLSVIFLVAYLLVSRNNNGPAVEGEAVRVSNDPLQTLLTDYFSFSVPKSWSEARELSDFKSVFSYRKIVSASPVGTLTIRVNDGSPSLITYLVPLEIEAGEIKEVGSASEHCSKSVPTGSNLNPHDVVVEEVSFRCWTDGTTYIVAAGVRGGGLEFSLLRPNGEQAKYSISYQSTSFEPDTNAILEVLKTFKTR